MQRRLHPLSRFLLLAAVLSLLVGYFVPLWQIQLWAPQYPEGLNMKIWINKLSGAFDIINGLNHYIGMALIKEEMFPEFGYMIYLLGGLIFAGLVAVVMGTRKWLWIYAVILGLSGLAGLVDFYRWGYEYGHNLDPHAAIQVPGMTYQPPLFGYKNLLNFTAYSGPDIGGWVLIGSGCLTGLLLGWEQFFRRKAAPAGTKAGDASTAAAAVAAVSCLLLAFVITGCDAGPEPMRYGEDACVECRMTISDQRFGAQIVTSKGRIFKFDDVCCLRDFIKKETIPSSDRKLTLVSDFTRPNGFIPVESALFLKSEDLKSPMRSDCAAFTSVEEMEKVRAKIGGGKHLKWAEVQASP